MRSDQLASAWRTVVLSAPGGPAFMGYNEWEVQTLLCGPPQIPVDCTSWTPADAVEEIAVHMYEIDHDFVTMLIHDSTPLLDCDEGRFEYIDPGFQLSGTAPDELFVRLGLRNGDVPIELNGYSLATFDDVADAFVGLLYSKETGRKRMQWH